MRNDYFSQILRSQEGTCRFHTFPTETNCYDGPCADDSAQKRAEDLAPTRARRTGFALHASGDTTARRLSADTSMDSGQPHAANVISRRRGESHFPVRLFCALLFCTKSRFPNSLSPVTLLRRVTVRLQSCALSLIGSSVTPRGLGVGAD